MNWREASFTVPPVGPCPRNTVDFTDGAGRTGESIYRFTPDREITYADVTGEGIEDALIFMDCGPPASEYSTAVIAVTTGPQGSIRPLGTVAETRNWLVQPTEITVDCGEIAVEITDLETGEVTTRHYRWAASAQAFVRID